MSTKIKGILFDLGETLLNFGKVDIPSLFERGTRRAYEYLRGLSHPLPAYEDYYKKQYRAIRFNHIKSRIISREFDCLGLIQRLGSELGQTLSKKEAEELAWIWYEPLGRIATVEDGAIETLRKLADIGLTLGLVSNTFVPGSCIDRHLLSEGLIELLPVRTYSSEVRYRKPGRKIFNVALEKNGLHPSQTLFVGDKPWVDIMGANRVGMISVLKASQGKFKRPSFLPPWRPKYRIHKLDELMDIVN